MNASYYYYLFFMLMIFIVIVSGLYLLLTGEADSFRPGLLLATIDPYFYVAMGQAASIALSVAGAGWGMLLTGAALIGAAVKAPHVRTKNLLSIIFCEVCGIYGLIIMIVMSGMNGSITPKDGRKFLPEFINCSIETDSNDISAADCAFTRQQLWIAYSIFWAGLCTGLANLFTGICIGVTGTGCVLADARNTSLFSKLLLITIFGSVMGLFALVVSLLLSTKLGPMGK